MKNTWPFKEAERILQHCDSGEIRLATGYGPSGAPHIGTFGEVWRTTCIKQAIENIDSSKRVRILAFSDDMDGLRKIPEGTPNSTTLEQNIGQSLTSVPNPFDSEYESYGEHMNALFKGFLDRFEFEYEFYSATQLYHSGEYNDALLAILKNYDKIMQIILPTIGQERQKTYSPFLPISPSSGRVLQVPIRIIDRNTIEFEDENGDVIATEVTFGKVKLQWKPDWGMRWFAMKITYEMHGKDLAPSAILSSKICKIIGARPPQLFQYELFLDENGQKISKSKGNGISIDEWLGYGSIESLKLYMMQTPQRAKRLHFDVISKTMDEYIQHSEKFSKDKSLENPIWHIHDGIARDIKNEGISLNMLMNLSIACNAQNKDILWKFIIKYAHDANPDTHAFLDQMTEFAVRYYNNFVKHTRQYYVPTTNEKNHLTALKELLSNCNFNIIEDELQSHVFALGKELEYTNLRDWFKFLYTILLGQLSGPKFGAFVMTYGIDNTITLIDNVLAR